MVLKTCDDNLKIVLKITQNNPEMFLLLLFGLYVLVSKAIKRMY
jgi:hypothetical protein